MLWRVEAVLITQRAEVSTTPRDRMLHTQYWQTVFAPPNHNSLSTRNELGQWVFVWFTPPSTVMINQKHVEATRNCTPCKLQYMYASMYTSYMKPTLCTITQKASKDNNWYDVQTHTCTVHTMYLQLYIMCNTHCRGWLLCLTIPPHKACRPLPLTSAHNNSWCSTPQSIVHTRPPHPGLLREGTPGRGWVDRSGTRTHSSVAHHPSQRRRAKLVTITLDTCTDDFISIRYKINLTTIWVENSTSIKHHLSYKVHCVCNYSNYCLLNIPVVKEPRTVTTGLSPSMAVTW